MHCPFCQVDHKVSIREPEKMNNGTLLNYYKIWREYADQQDIENLTRMQDEINRRCLTLDWICKDCDGRN